MKNLFLLLLLAVVFSLSGCRSLQETLQDIEKEKDACTAFEYAKKSYDEDKEEAEKRQLFEEYAERCFNSLLMQAENACYRHDLDLLRTSFLYGQKSIGNLITECRKRDYKLRQDANFDNLLAKYSNKYLRESLKSIEELDRRNEYAKLMNLIYDSDYSLESLVNFAKSENITLEISTEELDKMRNNYGDNLRRFYRESMRIFDSGDFLQARENFRKMGSYEDSENYLQRCENEIGYKEAESLMSSARYREAYKAYQKLPDDFKDVREKRNIAYDKASVRVAIAYFDGWDGQEMYRRIARELQQDEFIQVVNLENLKKAGGMNLQSINGVRIDLFITGNVRRNIYPKEFKNPGDLKVWELTGDYYQVKKNNLEPKTSYYIMKGRLVKYHERRAMLRVAGEVYYEIADPRTMVNLETGSFSHEMRDEVDYFYLFPPYQYSVPENFVLRDPSRDTIKVKGDRPPTWHANHREREFRAEFYKRQGLKPPNELWGYLVDDLARKVAKKIHAAINRMQK